jgi:uncharacterized membrane protein
MTHIIPYLIPIGIVLTPDVNKEFEMKLMLEKKSPAQMIDAFLRRTALCVGIVAILYAVQAYEQVAPEALAGYLDKLAMALSALVIILMLPSFLRFRGYRRSKACSRAEADSYIADRFKLAAHHAFTTTFISLVGLQLVIRQLEKRDIHLSSEFFIDASLAISLGAFALFFYRLVRDEDGEDDDAYDDEEQDA